MKEELFKLATAKPNTTFSYEIHTDDDSIIAIEKVVLVHDEKVVYCNYRHGIFESLEGWCDETKLEFNNLDEMSSFLWGDNENDDEGRL